MNIQTQSLFGVSGKVVVLTGVSGQLGAKYAEAYLMNGAHVAGLDIMENDRTKSLKKSYPNSFHFIISDITNRTSFFEITFDITYQTYRGLLLGGLFRVLLCFH